MSSEQGTVTKAVHSGIADADVTVIGMWSLSVTSRIYSECLHPLSRCAEADEAQLRSVESTVSWKADQSVRQPKCRKCRKCCVWMNGWMRVWMMLHVYISRCLKIQDGNRWLFQMAISYALYVVSSKALEELRRSTEIATKQAETKVKGTVGLTQ